MNWAALTKEAFAIYSSIKKLSYYLEDVDIVLRSDHLPLKKFLQKNTFNSKVNNWAVEISPYRYALTVICMFTGYTFCIPIPNKMAKTVLKAYMDNVYCQFGGSIKILSDNGTEFKNKLMEEVSKELGVEYKIYSPPYRPQSNGRIESFHYFLKVCIAKHIAPQLEWDDIVPLACTAYNFLPNEHSRESPCLEEILFSH